MNLKNKLFIATIACVCLSGLQACKPYNKPVFVEADTNEEVFVIPLEGDTSQQVRFESEDFLAQNQVAAKRIQVLRRWVSTGYAWYTGEYKPAVRVVKVDRSPVTRKWSVDTKNGIWAESNDSVGFSMDIVCTAMIQGKMAPKFLYNYPAARESSADKRYREEFGVNVTSSSLDYFMDTEIRGKVQQIFAREAAKYDMDELRRVKGEIMDAVCQETIPFFEAKGITITTLGLGGGLAYENPDIQKSIDQTFQDQQLKISAEAQRAEQEIKNKTIILQAQAQADKERILADGQAKAIGILVSAGGRPELFYDLRALEVQQQAVSSWNGQYPTMFLGGSEGQMPSLLLNVK